MSAQANIIAFDGATTPVSHTFVPDGVGVVDNEYQAKWSEKLTTVPDYAQVRVTQTRKKLKSGVYRVATTVEVPVMESISGVNSSGYTAAPKVAYKDVVQVIGYHHERSTINGRRLARQLAINIAGSIATSVAPVVTGPAPELMDQLIIAS